MCPCEFGIALRRLDPTKNPGLGLTLRHPAQTWPVWLANGVNEWVCFFVSGKMDGKTATTIKIPASGRVLAHMGQIPIRPWRAQRLSLELGLSQGSVQKAFGILKRHALLRREKRGLYRVTGHGLKALRENWVIPLGKPPAAPLPGRPRRGNALTARAKVWAAMNQLGRFCVPQVVAQAGLEGDPRTLNNVRAFINRLMKQQKVVPLWRLADRNRIYILAHLLPQVKCVPQAQPHQGQGAPAATHGLPLCWRKRL